MTKRSLGLILMLFATELLLTPRGAASQGLDLTTPAPQHPRERIGGVRQDRALGPGAPGYLAPLSKETAYGRAGVAGWIAPNIPVGARATTDPSGSGWLGFGVAIEWGGGVASQGSTEGATRRN